MADMAPTDDVLDAWDDLMGILEDQSIVPVTYMNSTAEIKALCGRNGGIVCTSSNAEDVFKWAFQKGNRILFLPDQHLGRNTGLKMGIPKESMIVWNPFKRMGGHSEEEYNKPGFEPAKYVMSPPLRAKSHQDALWRGLASDDLQVVSTDHCPFCFTEHAHGLKYSKQIGRDSFARIPNGAPGVETRLPLIFSGGVVGGRISLNRFVQLTATGPAKLFGLFPTKGTIAVGSDADLVLFDAGETWTIRAAEHHSRVDYSLFEGREITGRIKKVFLRGRMIVDGETWLGRKGGGEIIRRGASGAM